MDRADYERIARDVRSRAHLTDDDLVRAPEIIVRLLGRRALAMSSSMKCSGRLDRGPDGYMIVVRRGSPDVNFTLAHELAHWALVELVQFTGPRPEEERAANYIGAAILAPHASVVRAHRHWGEDLPVVSDAFGLAKTSMMLRLGEVRGDDRFVVTKKRHVLRRDATMLSDDDVRAAADEPRPKGLTKTELSGGIDEGRVAMLGDGSQRR